MPADAKGNEIHEGDVVSCKFRVTNIIADSGELNILAEHFAGHKGLPADLRITLESSQVEIVPPAKKPGAAEPKHESEHGHASAGKEHEPKEHEPKHESEHGHSAAGKEHEPKTHEPKHESEHGHSAAGKEHEPKTHEPKKH